MNRLTKRVLSLLAMFGVDLRRSKAALTGLPRYFRDLREFRKQQDGAEREEFPLGRLYPCLHDWGDASGTGSGYYFHQDLHVARRVLENGAARHVDVGSRINGFVAHVAVFRPIEVFDIRPSPGAIRNVAFVQADMMTPLPERFVGYCDSLSCLHALEHFGLGRYGDPINLRGYQLGLANLGMLLAKGGRLYFSVPIGPQRTEFNAHRVFSVRTVLDMLRPDFRLVHFSYVDDDGQLHETVEFTEDEAASSFGCTFGCGIFEMVRT